MESLALISSMFNFSGKVDRTGKCLDARLLLEERMPQVLSKAYQLAQDGRRAFVTLSPLDDGKCGSLDISEENRSAYEGFLFDNSPGSEQFFIETIDADPNAMCFAIVRDLCEFNYGFAALSYEPLREHWLKHSGYSVPDVETSKPRKPNNQKEKVLEDDLRKWLSQFDLIVEQQVSTTKHRLDLWIPGKLMLELKAGKVSGDDVCQAIDYFGSYQQTIVLVGAGLTNAGSRGIDGFNNSTEDGNIMFVTWDAVKYFLTAYLNLQ